MAVTCTADNLADLAKCWMGLSQTQLKAVQIYLICNKINGTVVTCDPDTIAIAATCFTAGIPQTAMDAVIAYLFCQLVNA